MDSHHTERDRSGVNITTTWGPFLASALSAFPAIVMLPLSQPSSATIAVLVGVSLCQNLDLAAKGDLIRTIALKSKLLGSEEHKRFSTKARGNSTEKDDPSSKAVYCIFSVNALFLLFHLYSVGSSSR